MTIHAAKGLEVPITIVSGMSARPGVRRSAVEVHLPRDRRGRVGYRMGKEVVTEEFEAHVPIDEQMGYDERIGLLYVRSEEHTSEPQSLMRITYAVFCLKKKQTHT